ncbi:MAG: hypothetical protein ABJO54_02865 [Hyphomicrobiales bacterium]
MTNLGGARNGNKNSLKSIIITELERKLTLWDVLHHIIGLLFMFLSGIFNRQLDSNAVLNCRKSALHCIDIVVWMLDDTRAAMCNSSDLSGV